MPSSGSLSISSASKLGKFTIGQPFYWVKPRSGNRPTNSTMKSRIESSVPTNNVPSVWTFLTVSIFTFFVYFFDYRCANYSAETKEWLKDIACPMEQIEKMVSLKEKCYLLPFDSAKDVPFTKIISPAEYRPSHDDKLTPVFRYSSGLRKPPTFDRSRLRGTNLLNVVFVSESLRLRCWIGGGWNFWILNDSKILNLDNLIEHFLTMFFRNLWNFNIPQSLNMFKELCPRNKNA